MTRCHACHQELNDADLAGGRCGNCGAPIVTSARRTVSGGGATVDFSVDSIDLDLSDDSHEGAPPKSTIDQSIGDTHTGEPESPPKSPTIADRGDMTIEFDAPADDHDDRPNAKPTIEGPNPNVTQDMAADFTIDFGGADPDLSAHMTSEWASAVTSESKSGMTLRQSGTINEFIARNTRSSLPVKNRSVRQSTGKSEGKMVPLTPGDVPDYELLEMIGKGGMGVVYAAHQSSIARTVAIKMLKPGTKVGDEARDKFISEAVVTGDLDHPNIVPIYDLGANDEGALFYSMKRVKGTPWEDVLKEKSLDENLNILMRVADAVAFAHAAGVMHRDLKPENVMLGDFGEVLVMDWGLARVTKAFRNVDAIYQADSLGGTPAYMAPEMARGPVENIDARSDVYLLGAILYEIVGGVAPHSGRDVMQCLMAAAHNKIDSIEETGELVDIALRAMSTKPEDRYQSVKDMQADILQYQSHSESLILTGNAAAHLEKGHAEGDYAMYARALYGCQEALTLWRDNHRASELLEETTLAYAGAALEKEDYDLGLSLLLGDSSNQQTLRDKLTRGKREREARDRRLKTFKRLATAAVLAFLVVVTYASYAINKQKNIAEAQREEAVRQRGIAEEKEQQAKAAEQVALEKKEEAEQAWRAEAKQKEIADKNAEIAKQQAENARKQEAIAVKQKGIADNARKAEEYEAYVARIGLAAAKIDENAFDSARTILGECDPRLRNWEWGRLSYLCGLSPKAYNHEAPVEAVVFSPDGRLLASGDWEGKLTLRDAATGEEVFSKKLAQYVHSVAFSPTGDRLAAGCGDGLVRLVDTSTGDVSGWLKGHAQGVLSVCYSPDGRRLLTSGYDSTARLWDLDSMTEQQRLTGHGWWVWSARFSPDASRIVTASQDGKAIVWRLNAAASGYQQLTMFDRHEGPVYDARFNPNGRLIASAGYDNTVCLWSPADVQATNLERRIDGREEVEPKYQRLEGHRGPVHGVAFSSDGSRLISASYDNSLRLWDAATGQSIKALRGHGAGVMACGFSPDSKWAASSGQDQCVRLWDVAGYEESRVLRGHVLADHVDAVLSAQFSADGEQIITASRDRSSKLWNAADGKLIETFQEGHEFLVSSAEFFDAGRRLATGAGDNSVRVWDVGAGAELFALRPTGRAAALAVSPDSKWIVTGGPYNQARIWPAVDGAKPFIMIGHEEEVTAAAVSADSRLAATGDDRGVIRVWELRDGAWRPKFEMKGHSRTITGITFAGANRLLSSSGDNTCGQWNLTTGQEDRSLVLKHSDWVSSVDYFQAGGIAVTACDDGAVRVWRLSEASVLAEYAPTGGAYSHVSFSPDGTSVLLTSSADRKVQRWNWREPEQPQTVLDWQGRGAMLWAARYAGDAGRILTIGGNDAQLWDARSGESIVRFSPHGAVSGAALSPDGRLAATGSWDNSVKLWNVATGKALRKLDGIHNGYVNSVEFSPADGKHLLTSSDDRTALILPVNGVGDTITLRGHRGRVLHATYSADGRRVLTTGSDQTARLWDAATGRELRAFRGHEWAVLCGAISPDGSRIITGSQDNTAIVWNTATGDRLLTLAGHTASVTSVAFNSDGTRALTGSQDRAAKLWDAVTGKEVLTLDGHTREVTSVAFSPNGRDALTASRDGTSILWLAEPWAANPPVAANP